MIFSTSKHRFRSGNFIFLSQKCLPHLPWLHCPLVPFPLLSLDSSEPRYFAVVWAFPAQPIRRWIEKGLLPLTTAPVVAFSWALSSRFLGLVVSSPHLWLTLWGIGGLDPGLRLMAVIHAARLLYSSLISIHITFRFAQCATHIQLRKMNLSCLCIFDAKSFGYLQVLLAKKDELTS